jgi:hypothetical protein
MTTQKKKSNGSPIVFSGYDPLQAGPLLDAVEVLSKP